MHTGIIYEEIRFLVCLQLHLTYLTDHRNWESARSTAVKCVIKQSITCVVWMLIQYARSGASFPNTFAPWVSYLKEEKCRPLQTIVPLPTQCALNLCLLPCTWHPACSLQPIITLCFLHVSLHLIISVTIALSAFRQPYFVCSSGNGPF